MTKYVDLVHDLREALQRYPDAECLWVHKDVRRAMFEMVFAEPGASYRRLPLNSTPFRPGLTFQGVEVILQSNLPVDRVVLTRDKPMRGEGYVLGVHDLRVVPEEVDYSWVRLAQGWGW